MAAIKVIQGQDSPIIKFSVYDEDGTVVPVADLNDYGVYIYNYQSDVRTKLYEFKKTPGVGENAMVSVDANTLGFIINRTMTAAISTGIVFAEVEVQTSATSDFQSSLQNSGGTDIAVVEIIESVNSGEF